MTTSTGLVLGCLGLLAASVMVGLADAHAVGAANASIAELDRRIDAANRRSRQTAAHIAAVTKEARQLKHSLAQLTVTRAAPTPKAPSAASVAAIEWAKRWEKQMEDPTVQNENLVLARAQLRDRFASLYRALHLTPQQIAAFEENEATYDARVSDLNAALVKERISSFDPVAVRLFSKLADEEKAAQKQVLGDSDYTAFQDFQRTSIVRGMVSRIVGATTVMGEPLNTEQSEQLVRVIAQSDQKYTAGGGGGDERGLGPGPRGGTANPFACADGYSWELRTTGRRSFVVQIQCCRRGCGQERSAHERRHAAPGAVARLRHQRWALRVEMVSLLISAGDKLATPLRADRVRTWVNA